MLTAQKPVPRPCVLCLIVFTPKIGGKNGERAKCCSKRCAKKAYRRTPNGKARAAEYRRRVYKKRGGSSPYVFWSQYGITFEEKQKIVDEQRYKCPICGEEGKKHHSTWATDHNHKAPRGTYRGIICKKCNIGLGMFRDNPKYLRAAIDYLVQAR